MPFANIQESIHVANISVGMNGNDGFGFFGDRFFDLGGIQIESIRLYIDEDRLRAGKRDTQCRGDERKGGQYDLIPGADPQAGHGQI